MTAPTAARLELAAHQLGKRFRHEWIFKNLDYTFAAPQAYVLLGHNGSGKSTLLKILAGQLTPSQGKLQYTLQQQPVPVEKIYQYVSFAAPYMELIEELTVQEHIQFHFRFKKSLLDRPADLLGFSKSALQRPVRYLSSGMKQRLKLLLAFTGDTPLLCLDEPTTNLDAQGVTWYLDMANRFAAHRLTIIASNIEHDYVFCHHQLQLTDFK